MTNIKLNYYETGNQVDINEDVQANVNDALIESGYSVSGGDPKTALEKIAKILEDLLI